MEIDKRYVGISDDGSEERYEIKVYRDEECTEEIKDIDFGPIEPGQEKSKWFWLKNTGEVYLPRVFVGMGIIGKRGWDSISESYLGGSLDIGEKCIAPFRLKVETDADLGEYLGSIPITVYGDEGVL